MSKISPKLATTSTSKILTIAAGCFWGVEHIYRKNFKQGIIDTKVGYANGITSDPTYKEVCTGSTNFAEALQISYDPSLLTYKQLIEFFFKMHDPTTVNSQGPDVGTQYRSAVFYHDEEQKKEANDILKDFQLNWYPKDKIATIVEPIQIFWDAEEYHQLYLVKNPTGYECPSHFVRTQPKI